MSDNDELQPKAAEGQETENTQQEPSHPPLVDFSQAKIRFQFKGTLHPKTPKKTGRSPLYLPLYSPRVVTAAMEAYLSERLEILAEKGRRRLGTDEADEAAFQQTLASGVHPRGDVFDRALTREGSEWTNAPVDASGVTNIIPGIPAPIAKEEDDSPLAGVDAIYFAIRNTQSGSPAVMPLWHSGIRLQQNPPTNERVAIMHERIAQDKIQGGRNTGGFAFSATSVISMKHAVELALETVYAANVPDADLDAQKLMTMLPVTDVPAILLNTLQTMYPYGFPYVQSCYQNPETCAYRVEDTISFAKIYQVDNSTITKRMREIMTQEPLMTAELRKEYRNELGDADHRQLDLSTDGRVIIEFAVPSIAESISAGERWLQDITNDLKDVLSRASMSPEQRERIITERQFYSWMRQYDAWIKSIHVDAKGTMRPVVKKDIPLVLAQLSRDGDLRQRYLDGVMQFIADSTIALAAMPTWVCPVCNEDIGEELRDKKYYDLIAIDVPQIFFTLNSVQALMENMGEVL